MLYGSLENVGAAMYMVTNIVCILHIYNLIKYIYHVINYYKKLVLYPP